MAGVTTSQPGVCLQKYQYGTYGQDTFQNGSHRGGVVHATK